MLIGASCFRGNVECFVDFSIVSSVPSLALAVLEYLCG